MRFKVCEDNNVNPLFETCRLICVAPPQVKYKEKYEKEKGKAMLDFETPTYVTAKEAQHMQSQVKTSSTTSSPLLPFPKSVGNLVQSAREPVL